MYRFSDIITVQNSFDKHTVIERSNHKEVKLIPNNMNVGWLSDKRLSSSNQSKCLKKVCFIGSLIMRKGIKDLVNAYVNLINKGYNIELHILGEGPLKEEILKMKEKYKLNQLYLIGYSKSPLSYLSEMDLLVVPSYIDSFPNVVFEAWYVGVPVIGSNVGGIADQLKYDQLLFTPGKVAQIEEKIGCLYNQEQYKAIRKLNESRKEEFTFDWVGEYERVIVDMEAK